MKSCKPFLLLLSLLMTGLSSGCFNLSELTQTGVQTTYYTLEYEPAITAAEKIPHTLKINHFTAAPLFSSKKIIYKEKDFQTSEYLYHQWHVMPAEGVSYLLARDMRQSGIFKAVFDPASAVPAPFSLDGNLEMFLEDNTEAPWKARIAIEIRLIDETEPDIGKSVLLQKLYADTEPCARENPRATAEAMSRALRRVSEKIIKDVYDQLKDK